MKNLKFLLTIDIPDALREGVILLFLVVIFSHSTVEPNNTENYWTRNNQTDQNQVPFLKKIRLMELL
jgi:hypothetical protein